MQKTVNKIELASRALLSMQRHSWEQGTAMQAFLEMGETDTVIAMAYEAAYRRLPDGRTAMLGDGRAVTDPCSVGVALKAACEWTGDAFLYEAYRALLNWALEYAPRNERGALYHLSHLEEFWVDSLYMLPPFLLEAGYVEEALVNFYEYANALYDKEAHLMGHRWDDGAKEWVRRDHWGTGNGWALAAMARMIPRLLDEKPVNAEFMIASAIDLIEHLLPLMREDGLFHDVVDDDTTFVETNLSQMLAYTIYRGVEDGWISGEALIRRYLAAADKMREAANAKVNAYGFVTDVCGAPTFDKPGISPEGQAFYLLMEQAAKDFYRPELRREIMGYSDEGMNVT